jgi:F-type H+-transporting ATPase subunit a
MGFLKHAIMLINLIIPTGVNVYLHFLLVPIEMISYIFRPISLSIRLFANIMAGHTLLKVICGFLFNFIKSNIFFLLILIPFTFIIILFGLETFVAFIQTYVFLILLCLFLKDILSLTH